MSTTVSLDWNEVLIARKHLGVVTCWTAWRRDISAFADPALWGDPSVWPTYFTAQPKNAGWGFEGYGLIVSDMDAKKLYSVNDYQLAGSVHFPMDSLIEQDPEKAHAPLRKLLSTPSEWPNAKLEARSERLVGPAGEAEQFSLDQILLSGATLDQAFTTVSVKRGLMHFNGAKWHVYGATYQPDGWATISDRGQEEPEFTMTLLRALHEGGFPAPDWANIDNRIEQFLQDCEDEDADRVRVDLAALKAAWSEQPEVSIDLGM